MGMTIYQFREKLQIDLKSATAWSNAELDRCVERAVQDLSRYMPLQQVYEATLSLSVSAESFTTPASTSATAIVNAKDISSSVDGNTCTLATKSWSPARTVKLTITDANTSITSFTVIVKGIDENGYYQEESFYHRGGLTQTGLKYFAYISEVEIDQITGNGASDVLSVGTGLHTGIWQPLANKPIKPLSETITSSPAGTTYARDTDYEMDYINGRVRLISGGAMAAATAYLATYTKSEIGVSIATILPVLTRISRVEYPTNLVPQKFASFRLFGDFLYIGSQGVGESQSRMVTQQHIAIYYERPQYPPSTVSAGSYPENLDEVICIGAGAYALLIEALQYEIQAETDLTALGTALTNVAKYLDNNGAEDEASLLALIATDIASLRTAVVTAADAANAMIDGLAAAEFTDADTALDTGEPLINATNEGKDVGALYSEYSKARQGMAAGKTNAAMVYIQEANVRLGSLQTYIQQSAGYDSISGRFIQEAQFRAEQVNGDLVLADRFRAEGIERLNEFYAVLKARSEWHRKASTSSLTQPA